jgi:hypothetical protein
MKRYTTEEYAQGMDLKMEATSANGSSFAVVNETDTNDEDPSGTESAKENKSPSLVPRKSTGPRTPQGKERTKRNALRHGIFSSVVVLKGESQVEFDALLNGLRNSHLPEGELEELLVDKLATLHWRGRRILIAEAAEIRAQGEFVEWDGKERYRQEAARLPQLSCNGGLIRWIDNPEALQGCLGLLEELKEGIDEVGFVPDYDRAILTKLYGSHTGEQDDNWKKTLFDSYINWLRTAQCSDVEREQGYASPEECKQNLLEEVNEEIQKLERYRKEHTTILARRLELESLRRTVPEGPQLDRLLRYETANSREIERTQNQLERVQRMRLGQPVPPPINLNVTASND